MTEKLNLYRCKTCGNIVEVVIDGAGSLVCCGEDMELLKSKSTDGAYEKHVPVIEHKDSTKIIRVGSLSHPMTEEHYIQFIEAISKDGRYLKRKYLYPNEEPELVIKCLKDDDFKTREYCNIHGLYMGEKENDGE